MSEPLETLLFVHRLTLTEKIAVYTHNQAFPSSGLAAAFATAIQDVCIDKFIRADGCFELAKSLATNTENESQRASIGRAYYCIHHCLRAMLLWQNQWDPDGHGQSIEEFGTLLKDNTFCNRSGLAVNTEKRVAEAQTNRHVADYSPYIFQRNPLGTGLISISNGN